MSTSHHSTDYDHGRAVGGQEASQSVTTVVVAMGISKIVISLVKKAVKCGNALRQYSGDGSRNTIALEDCYVALRNDSGPTEILGLSFRKIGSRVGRNQATVKRICDHWMQEGRVRSHPPQCTTSREDKQIVCMEVLDRSITSRTIALHIEFVTHHSVSARTIRCRFQQSGLSARPPLLGIPLMQNHTCLRHEWCNEIKMWAKNGMKLSLLTSHASVCNTTTVGLESGDTVDRGCCLAALCTATLVLNRILCQITLPAATPDQLWHRVEAAWSVVPQEHIQGLFESMPRRVAAVIFNNGSYFGY
ncbi:transposable element Tcb1 transposase [Trichonephila clavipes]|nr:transposable element Tcb1 transposase [Trichonephila clavipes]